MRAGFPLNLFIYLKQYVADGMHSVNIYWLIEKAIPRQFVGSLLLIYRSESCSVLSNCATPWVTRNLPGSSAHGILQAGILEWVAIPSPGGLLGPGIEPRSPTLQADSLPTELCESERCSVVSDSLRPRAPYSPGLWVCLFRTLRINGGRQCMAFCLWLLPLGSVFSRISVL